MFRLIDCKKLNRFLALTVSIDKPLYFYGVTRIPASRQFVEVAQMACFQGCLRITCLDLFQAESEQLFDSVSQPSNTPDIEDIGTQRPLNQIRGQAKITSVKRKRGQSEEDGGNEDSQLTRSWRDTLGPPPPMGTTKVQ